MKFSEKLKQAMQELNLNQKQAAGLIGKSKGSVSMYLSNKVIPPKNVQREIAVSLGLAPDYFQQERAAAAPVPRETVMEGKIERMDTGEAAVLLGMSQATVRKGLQQGVFPWGYGIKTSADRWTYFINAKRFVEIELGIATCADQEGQTVSSGTSLEKC